MLLKNESLQLTDFYDCVEAVRIVGSTQPETLVLLESMKNTVALSEEYLYYLKIQLIAIDAKLTFYQTRSDLSFETKMETRTSMQKLIEVINISFLLKDIASKKMKLSEQAELSTRCFSYFIRNFLDEKFTKEPLITAQEKLRSDLEQLVEKCKISSSLEPEICLYCLDVIQDGKLFCELNHKLARCVITKLQIPIGTNNFCLNCNCGIIDLDTIKSVTGRSQNLLCPFCDQSFVIAQ